MSTIRVSRMGLRVAKAMFRRSFDIRPTIIGGKAKASGSGCPWLENEPHPLRTIARV